MKVYSFIKPKKKPLFKEDTKLWLIFIIASLFLYIIFAIFLLFKAYLFNKDSKELITQIDSLKQKITQIKAQKEFIYKQKVIYENIITKNDLVKQEIKNLLDLIPDPITLEKFYIDNNKLIIYGITPTKDIYNLLMLPPLQSIFEKTQTYFYELPNGWYRFKSENFIKSEDENQTTQN
ncbi:hypothetical protein FE773_08780 [Caminibacter mediatlanticus TB-2]|uniref:PilN domain-containing protein n=1 Tax=Caminibacter mediatlanticus TB-2 TaxID=391592 RepID=A0ABX5VAJ6_9BACT|nr:hypothetical protein [Caminibacter mediatlanticus]QCT95283.1 hypothetical protein FE773_08780 [Caminibacter mediatlanticus TB-2]